jgi:hypothetical protein
MPAGDPLTVKETIMSQSSPAAAAHKSTGGAGMLIGLVPWVLFTIIAEHGTLKIAAIAALVIAIGVCVYSSQGGGRPKLIEGAAVVTFAVFTVIALVADPSLSHWLTRYARAIAAAAGRGLSDHLPAGLRRARVRARQGEAACSPVHVGPPAPPGRSLMGGVDLS